MNYPSVSICSYVRKCSHHDKIFASKYPRFQYRSVTARIQSDCVSGLEVHESFHLFLKLLLYYDFFVTQKYLTLHLSIHFLTLVRLDLKFTKFLTVTTSLNCSLVFPCTARVDLRPSLLNCNFCTRAVHSRAFHAVV